MFFRVCKICIPLLAVGAGLSLVAAIPGQDAAIPGQAAGAAPSGDVPQVPQGVEVMARGPVHEAFATPTSEPVPTKAVAKQPPQPLDEMPPAEKPEGNVVWIGGYWAWDDERNDFLWVSGTWRVPPPGKHWVAGYWKEDSGQWRWVPGFWMVDEQSDGAEQQITYMPAPPGPPDTAPPGNPPAEDTFYVPGHWEWRQAGYVTVNGASVYRDASYFWIAGYWARVQPGYVWVPAHYRWTPSGYIFIPGYWDLAIAHRGFLYAPVVVDYSVVGPTFVYTPAYAVSDTLLVDAMFVRPAYCHYYFGDYYGSVYVGLGFESCAVYSRRHYDAIFVYSCYEHRYEPGWASLQIDISLGRAAGRYPVPPRTLVQQNTIINNVTNVTNVTNVVNNNTTNINRTTVTNNQVLMPTARLAAAKGIRTVPLDSSTRVQAKQQAQAVQQVALQRSRTEVAAPGGRIAQPRTAALSVPRQQPVISRLGGDSSSHGLGATRPAAASISSGVHPAQANAPRPGGNAMPQARGPAQPGRPGYPPLRGTGTPPGARQPQRTLMPPARSNPRPSPSHEPPKNSHNEQKGP